MIKKGVKTELKNNKKGGITTFLVDPDLKIKIRDLISKE
jgi:hypothetical protein